jgi:glyoxylase-like metal-dependent hydrolase (beta-lactamase superfamily II)
LEALFIPAHDSGSIAFLDKKERLLFTGDEVGRNVPLMWQRPDEQPTIEQYMNNMEKLMSRRKEYDFICTGHGEDLIDASYVDKCLACAKQILAGFDGEPLSERDIGPPPPKPGDDPRKKKGPRPGDLIIYDIEFKRIAEYDSVKLMYDIRYKFNSKQG